MVLMRESGDDKDPSGGGPSILNIFTRRMSNDARDVYRGSFLEKMVNFRQGGIWQTKDPDGLPSTDPGVEGKNTTGCHNCAINYPGNNSKTLYDKGKDLADALIIYMDAAVHWFGTADQPDSIQYFENGFKQIEFKPDSSGTIDPLRPWEIKIHYNDSSFLCTYSQLKQCRKN